MFDMVALSCAVKKWNVCIPGQLVSAPVPQAAAARPAGRLRPTSIKCAPSFSPAGAVWCGVRWVFKYFYKSELVILVRSDSVHFVPSTLTQKFLKFDEIKIL